MQVKNNLPSCEPAGVGVVLIHCLGLRSSQAEGEKGKTGRRGGGGACPTATAWDSLGSPHPQPGVISEYIGPSLNSSQSLACSSRRFLRK